ncbi:MAG: CocE/NonD family hydrolase C-terminal non-catalytic domain-containing protein, partial [Mycobacteriales bacterium]
QDTQYRYWESLTKSRYRRLYMGTRWEGHGTPGGAYNETVNLWMARWLKGERNGIERTLAPVVSQTSDSTKALGEIRGGIPHTTDVALYAQSGTVNGGYDGVLRPTRPGQRSDGVRFTMTGVGTESGALARARRNDDHAWFESPPLTRDVRLFGRPRITVWSEVDRSWVTYAVSVVDIDPANYTDAGGERLPAATNGLIGVTRGWLDTRYRNTLTRREPWVPGVHGVTIPAKPQDYIFRRGHAIGLLVMNEQLEWVVTKPYDDPLAGQGVAMTVDNSGKTVLHLPLVGTLNPRSLFS